MARTRRGVVEFRSMLRVGLMEPHRQQHIDAFSSQLRPVVAELPFQLGIHEHDRSRRVDHQNAARAGFDREFEFARGKFLLRDVADDFRGADALAGPRSDRGHT